MVTRAGARRGRAAGGPLPGRFRQPGVPGSVVCATAVHRGRPDRPGGAVGAGAGPDPVGGPGGAGVRAVVPAGTVRVAAGRPGGPAPVADGGGRLRRRAGRADGSDGGAGRTAADHVRVAVRHPTARLTVERGAGRAAGRRAGRRPVGGRAERAVHRGPGRPDRRVRVQRGAHRGADALRGAGGQRRVVRRVGAADPRRGAGRRPVGRPGGPGPVAVGVHPAGCPAGLVGTGGCGRWSGWCG
jgi:hypothetical protein